MTARRPRLAALVGALALTGCGSSDPGPRDVLLITIDTLRADMLSCYGHGRRSSPSLDRLARDGALFERHYATAPMTGPSHATLFTGLYSSEHGLVKNGRMYPSEPPCLAEELSRAGYQTLAVVGSKVLDRQFGMDRGFDVYDDAIETDVDNRRGRRTSAERFASEVVDSALHELAAFEDDQPVFAWLHVFDPHAPFEAPVELLPRRRAPAVFAERLEPNAVVDAEKALVAYIGYEQEVAYTDRELGRFLDAWDGRERGADSVICVTSDHGEGMGEHGYMGHGLFLYEEQLHVPFLLRARGAIEREVRVAKPTSAADVAYTLLALSGAVADVAVPGADLSALTRGDAEVRGPVAERPLFSQWDFDRPQRKPALELYPDRGRSRDAQVALVDGDWKYIWSADVGPELYDLAADAREGVNLAERQPDRIASFEGRLATWRSARIPAFVTGELTDDATRAMLEELGYFQEPLSDE